MKNPYDIVNQHKEHDAYARGYSDGYGKGSLNLLFIFALILIIIGLLFLISRS